MMQVSGTVHRGELMQGSKNSLYRPDEKPYQAQVQSYSGQKSNAGADRR